MPRAKKYTDEEKKQRAVAAARRWRERNPERMKEMNANYRRANREYLREYARDYYARNVEQIKTQRREYYLAIEKPRLKARLDSTENSLGNQ